jgi:hypothetical protein
MGFERMLSEYVLLLQYVHNMVPMVPFIYGTRVQIKHYLKNNLKYKHSGATGTLVGVVSIEGITVYYS